MRKLHKAVLGLPVLAASLICIDPFGSTKILANDDEGGHTAAVAAVETDLKPNIVAYSMNELADKTGYVIAYSLNVRNQPWGSTIGIMNQGDAVHIIGTEKDWLKINYNGAEAYVHSSWISVDGYDYTVPVDGFLLDEGVNCYDENGKIIGTIDEEKQVEIIADADYFWLVKSEEGMYYVLKNSVDCEAFRTETEADLEKDDAEEDDTDDTGDTDDGPFTEFVANLEDELGDDEPAVVENKPNEDEDDDSDDGSALADGSNDDDNDESDNDEDSSVAENKTVAPTTSTEEKKEIASNTGTTSTSTGNTTTASKPSTTSTDAGKTANDKLATTTTKETGSKTATSTTKPAKSSSSSSTYVENSYRTLQGKKVTLPKGEKIYFLDVSDVPPTWKKKGKNLEKGSDCIILESNGKFAMIDAGINNSKKFGLNMTNRIWRYLKELGATKLEFVLFSHTHGDHDGCFKDLVKKGLKVKTLYIKKDAAGRYDSDVKYGKKAGATIYNVDKHKSTKFKLGDMSFVLYNTKKHNYSEKNMNTIGVLAKIHDKKVYLSGDMQSPKSGTKIADNVAKEIGKVDVYKVAHHGYVSPGTGYNNSTKSIGYLKPKYAVITNTNRRLKSSHSSVVSRLKKYASSKNIYFAGSGTVVMNISESGKITFKQLKANK